MILNYIYSRFPLSYSTFFNLKLCLGVNGIPSPPNTLEVTLAFKGFTNI